MRTILPLLLLCCCQTKTVDEILSNHYDRTGKTSASYGTLTTKANCQGPDGAYITRTESSLTDDYLLFRQDYHFKPNPFYAVVYSKKEGYGLDSTLADRGTLSEPVIAVLKAHEFHELMLQVGDRYSNMEKGEDTLFFEVSCHQIEAVDHLDYPVKLYFNRKSRLMEGMSQANPYRKGEIIRVHFENWEKQQELRLFKNVTIHQGKDQQYMFEYQEISFDDPAFVKLQLQ